MRPPIKGCAEGRCDETHLHERCSRLVRGGRAAALGALRRALAVLERRVAHGRARAVEKNDLTSEVLRDGVRGLERRPKGHLPRVVNANGG